MADAHSPTLLQHATSFSTSSSYPCLLYKFLAFVVFLIAMPFFPSQAPRFLNKILVAGSWELLHLLFVGIAVSYGFFSSRNRNSEKMDARAGVEIPSSQYDFSRCFQTTTPNTCEISMGSEEGSESQIWRAPSYVDDQPLFLPLRSLKCCDSHTDLGKSLDPPAPFGLEPRGGDSRDFVNPDAEEGFEDVIPTPSLLSWRSISGCFKDECLQQCIPQSDAASSTHFPKKLAFSSAGRYVHHLECNNYQELEEKNHMVRTWSADGGKSNMESKSGDGDGFGSNWGRGMGEGVQVIEEPPPLAAVEERGATREGNFQNSEVVFGAEEKEDKGEEDESDEGRDCGRDVDKKADEFIAKFRERIRLQRIDSIKRWSRDHHNN